MDGNPVPTPVHVPVLWLGTAERISAIVEMNHAGIWVMGDLAGDHNGTIRVPHGVVTAMGQPSTARASCKRAITAKTIATMRA
jgi:hypothetical protein